MSPWTCLTVMNIHKFGVSFQKRFHLRHIKHLTPSYDKVHGLAEEKVLRSPQVAVCSESGFSPIWPIARVTLRHLFFSFVNRKPKREEHLSEEAIKVIASLPDLTFMHAKVLMFPTTLTPSTSSQEKADE